MERTTGMFPEYVAERFFVDTKFYKMGKHSNLLKTALMMSQWVIEILFVYYSFSKAPYRLTCVGLVLLMAALPAAQSLPASIVSPKI